MRYSLDLLIPFLAAVLTAPGAGAAPPEGPSMRLYVGTYTGTGGSKGIYQLHMDCASGVLSAPELAAELPNPSFLALHPNGRFLYAVSETRAAATRTGAGVTAFAIAPGSGNLTQLNAQSTPGVGPCYVSIDPLGTAALVAHYTSGSVCALPLGSDGRLAPATATIQHHGSGPNSQRQEGPHAHCIDLDPAGRFAFVADLGLDQIRAYRFERTGTTLTANDPPVTALAAGAGPRHLAFHPTGRFVYAINELANTITAFSYDPQRGALTTRQNISTLPPDFHGPNTAAEIHMHPNGRFLYGSNRGHNSIAIFAIDPQTGALTSLGHQSTQGKAPRYFSIDPTGVWLVAANQESGTLVAFRIDQQSGSLTSVAPPVALSAPVCIVFLPVEGVYP